MFDSAIRLPPAVPTRFFAEGRAQHGLPNRFDLRLADLYGRWTWRLHRDERARRQLADDTEARWQALAGLADNKLLDRAQSIRQSMRRNRTETSALADALALACETSTRRLGLRPFREQILGSIVLLSGKVAEMATGEGKTLTAGLAAVCAALRGQPVHVVTVNEYLADRDGNGLRPLFDFFGLAVGIVQSGQAPAERRDAYAAPITYCTNKDVVFDYLRTQLALGVQVSARRAWLTEVLCDETPPAAVLTRLGLAIVDEVDSVLVDEARTPLIISQDRETGRYELHVEALNLASTLVRDVHFIADEQLRRVELTEAGREHLRAQTADRSGLWRSERAREHLCLQALTARHLFQRDRDYIVRDDKVHIVDEFTGRVLPDRSWERGLHQMIEVKEGTEVTKHRESIARITYQRFFTRYEALAGMTGTASEVAGELWAIYGLRVVAIPTHRPVRRNDLGSRLLANPEDRWAEIARRCGEMVEAGRAVLVGTRSVRQSEQLSDRLTQLGVAHLVLNAKQDAHEAEVVAQAGQPGRVTVATNMAGRGTDIKLHPSVADAGGLHVILTEYHESKRIDRQLFGRGSRQGDAGSCEAIVCVDDDIFTRFARGPRRIGKFLAGEDREVGRVWASVLRSMAQRRAERLHAQMRLSTLVQESHQEQMMAFAGRSE